MRIKPLQRTCSRCAAIDHGRIAEFEALTAAVPGRRTPLSADPLGGVDNFGAVTPPRISSAAIRRDQRSVRGLLDARERLSVEPGRRPCPIRGFSERRRNCPSGYSRKPCAADPPLTGLRRRGDLATGEWWAGGSLDPRCLRREPPAALSPGANQGAPHPDQLRPLGVCYCRPTWLHECASSIPISWRATSLALGSLPGPIGSALSSRRIRRRRSARPASRWERVNILAPRRGASTVRPTSRARPRTRLPSRAAQQGLAADNRQLGVPGFGSVLASGLCGMALTVSAVCCS
jgi:hypothetical protein